MLQHVGDIFDHFGLLDASWSSWELMLENLGSQDGEVEAQDGQVEAQEGVREANMEAQDRIPRVKRIRQDGGGKRSVA